MRKDAEESSVAEVVSTHAPTTIPEEPTPVSPASPAIPVDAEAPEPEQQARSEALPEQPKPPAGRFIENISSDGSRASAEDDAEAKRKAAETAPNGVPETEMKQARSSKQASNVFCRSSKRKHTAQASKVDARASSSQSQCPASRNDHHVSPSTESSMQKA
ncbi:hypothetical protein, partial [Sporisorium scitamineum]